MRWSTRQATLDVSLSSHLLAGICPTASASLTGILQDVVGSLALFSLPVALSEIPWFILTGKAI